MRALQVGDVLIHAIKETTLTGTVFATVVDLGQFDITIEYPDGKRRLVPGRILYNQVLQGRFTVEGQGQ